MNRKNVSVVRRSPGATRIAMPKQEPQVARNNSTPPDGSNPRSRKLPTRQYLLIGGGILLVGLSMAQLFAHQVSARQGEIRGNSQDAVNLGTTNGDSYLLASPGQGSVNGQTFRLADGSETRPNPTVPWLEMVFCRGRQVSTGCSGRIYHPYLRWWESFAGDPKVATKWKVQAAREILATFGQGISGEE